MTLRQSLLLHHLLQGKTAKSAALAAGYSTATVSQNLSRLLCAPALQAQFQRHLKRIEAEQDGLRSTLDFCRSMVENQSESTKLRLSASRLVLRLVSTLRRCIVPPSPEVKLQPAPQQQANQTPTASQPNTNQTGLQLPHNQQKTQTMSPHSQELQRVEKEIDRLLEGIEPPVRTQQAQPKLSFKQKLAQQQRQRSTKINKSSVL